jgi:hypothetical protein
LVVVSLSRIGEPKIRKWCAILREEVLETGGARAVDARVDDKFHERLQESRGEFFRASSSSARLILPVVPATDWDLRKWKSSAVPLLAV